MLFEQVAATSALVAAMSSRTAKRDLIAELLTQLHHDEIAAVVSFLVGEPRQGRVGVGWRTLAAATSHADESDPSRGSEGGAGVASLTVTQVDHILDELDRLHGSGSGTRRRELVDSSSGGPRRRRLSS